MTCEVTKFCVSFVTICVSAVGVNRFVAAWNSHYISGMAFYGSYKGRVNYHKQNICCV